MQPSDDGERAPKAHAVAIVCAGALPIIAARALPHIGSTKTLLTAALAAVVVAVVMLRPRMLLVALALLIGARAAGELAQLTPIPTAPVVGVELELIDDPRPSGFGWRAVADLDGSHVQLNAPIGSEMASAGDRLVVSGTQRGSEPETSWAVSRQLVGSVGATELRVESQASGPVGLANAVRRTIRAGARSLPPTRQVLFTGLVFGDDRGQDVIVADNFRASGLGHLLAVSGQNVVFVLLLAAPALGRLRSIPARVVLSLVVLIGFGFLTRFEASVTRAIVMAGLAVIAHAVGRAAHAGIVLPPAVAGLIVFDPLLAWSLAFQLSVAATLGLVVLMPIIADELAGPAALRLPVAATVSAQLFVSPLLFATFGHVSVVAVPANLLAAPAAAGAMMWGLVAGPIAGISPGWLATLIHFPTRALLWWIDGVASTFAQLHTGRFTPWHLLVGVLALVACRFRPRTRRVAVAALLTAVLPTLIVPKPLPPGHHVLVEGVSVARSVSGHDVVVINGSARPGDVIDALRRANLGRIDLVVADGGSRSVGRVVSLVDRRFDVVDIWAPVGHQVPRGRVVEPLLGWVGSLHVSRDTTGEVVISDGAPR